MKTRFILHFACIGLFCLLALTATAQTPKPKLNKFSMGFQLNLFQKDFGTGLQFTSPYIVQRIAFRLRGNIQWLDYQPIGQTNTIWSPYGNVCLSIVVRQFVIPEKLSVYSEGGGILLINNSAFSSNAVGGGGFGLFGFEFNPTPRFGYHVELGGVGTGANADRGQGNPIYSNGFLVMTGMRFYF